MVQMSKYDAVVVGSGPNGLAAAITLAQAGMHVAVFEAKDTIGGGMRSAEVTLPGFLHDICATAHPLGKASPFFRSLALDEYGLGWVHPPAECAHPFDDGTAVTLERSVEATAESLGYDGGSYKRIFAPLADRWLYILEEFLGPLRFPRPQNMLSMGFFGLLALPPATVLAQLAFRNERARGLFAGLAAHAIQPLGHPATAAFGLMLGMLGHAVGWPLARGGSQRIADALGAYLRSLGGEIHTGVEIKSLAELPDARVTMLDITPKQVLAIAGDSLPERYRRDLSHYRYGPGVFKIDYALSDPIPWTAANAKRAATVHLGGTMAEIRRSERDAWHGRHSDAPYTLVVQPTLFDPSRAPEGQHIAWAYCHVPHGSTVDMTDAIERQIERFAPGFRQTVLARSTRHALEMERYNPNYIGGDINGGVQDLRQLFTRPLPRIVPYSTPLDGVYLCSSSTPPGGGVHGMCGYHAAKAALRVHG